VEEYFYGKRNNVQNAAVQYILDGVVNELLQDKNKKFIYVEVGFFYLWWTEQDSEK